MSSNQGTPPEVSAGANRMRLYRMRKRYGMRCLTIELPEKHVVALIQRGYLKQHERNDQDAVINALYVLLARALE